MVLALEGLEGVMSFHLPWHASPVERFPFEHQMFVPLLAVAAVAWTWEVVLEEPHVGAAQWVCQKLEVSDHCKVDCKCLECSWY